MTDAGRDINDVRDEDRLPWLEAVDDEEVAPGPSALKLIASVIIALIAIGVIVGGIFWLKNREEAPQGDASVIPAPTSPYKVKPVDAGGMKVEGAGDTAYAASEGADHNSQIDLSAMPETALTPGKTDAAAPAHTQAAAMHTPVAAPPTQSAAAAPPPVKPAPVVARIAPKPTQVAKVPTTVVRAPPAVAPQKALAPDKTSAGVAAATGGGTVQLGAFSSEAKANAAWKSLSHRFGFLGGMTPAVTPVTVSGSTLYRLRTSTSGQGGTICAKLKVAGETCAVVE